MQADFESKRALKEEEAKLHSIQAALNQEVPIVETLSSGSSAEDVLREARWHLRYK